MSDQDRALVTVETEPFELVLRRADNVRVLLVERNAVVSTTLTINWDLLGPKWRWAAMDAKGAVYVYTHEPQRISDGYQRLMGEMMMIAEPYSRQWATTLQGRP